jgi:hypothetical protein
MHINQVAKQKLTVSKRTHKHVASGAGESEQLSRPAYDLWIRSYPNEDTSKYAIIRIGISKGLAEALIQDHGAVWE